jgi:hypothetical protein
VDCFATEEGDGDERDVDWSCDAGAGANLDFTLDTWLESVNQWLGPGAEFLVARLEAVTEGLTIVAEIPGYPIRKLPFAGPETRTKAAISNRLFP